MNRSAASDIASLTSHGLNFDVLTASYLLAVMLNNPELPSEFSLSHLLHHCTDRAVPDVAEVRRQTPLRISLFKRRRNFNYFKDPAAANPVPADGTSSGHEADGEFKPGHNSKPLTPASLICIVEFRRC